MASHFSTIIFHFRRKHPFQNLLLKPPLIISSFSSFAPQKQSYPFYRKTFSPYIFQECAKAKAIQPGRQAHARMIVSAFKPTVFAVTCLLQMYIKCSRLECAVKVFDRMPERNCVSWTAMIFGYSLNGKMELAQSLFDLMPERNVISWTSLISGYSVNGKMGLAQSLFDLMPERNVISWTALISGYLQNGNCLKSVEVFVMMGRDGVAYNVFTFSIVLKAIASMEDYVLGVQAHGVVVKLGFENNVYTGNAMLSMYAKCQMLDDSLQFFDAMPMKDCASWSAMISGCVENGELEDALELFKKMQREGVGVPQSVYASVFKSCAGLSDSRLAPQLHGHALKSVGADTIVGNAILDMYAKCNNLVNATKVFNLLPNQDILSYTLLIVGYARGECGFEGIQLFLQLFKSNLGFDEISLSAAFSACAVNKGLVVGTQMHGLAIKTPFHDDIYVANAILDMYGKCGALLEARHIFDEMEKRDVVMWNTMVCAYGDHGYGNEALQVFEKMVVEKVKPDHATFVGVLHACVHSGLVDEALHYLYIMKSRYGLEPNLQHYSCVVDALGRCGRFIDALKIIENMPFKANDVIWRSLLSSCRMHGNVEVAEIAGRSLFQLDPKDFTVYVLLSEIYTHAGMLDKASKTRRIVRSSGLKTKAGCSWIEI